jgi:ankyrin repeat protein
MKHDFDLLQKYIPNLNISAPNYCVINACVENNRPDVLIKYVKEKNIQLDRCIKDDTPLSMCIRKRYYECFKILIENKCKIYMSDGNNLTPFCVLLLEIKKGTLDKNISDDDLIFFKFALNTILPIKFDDNALDTSELELLLSPKKMFNSIFYKLVVEPFSFNSQTDFYKFPLIEHNMMFHDNDIVAYIELMKCDDYGFIKYVIDKRPYILLKMHGEQPVIAFLYKFCKSELVHYVIDSFPKMIFFKNIYTLHWFTYSNQMEYVWKLLEKYPKKINDHDENGRTIFDTLFITKEMSDDEIIDNMDRLIKLGANPNNFLNSGTRCINMCLQFKSNKVLTHLIQYVTKDIEHIDPVDIACQLEKLDKLMILIDSDFTIFTDEVLGVTLPRCIKKVLCTNNCEIMKYIIDHPKFGITDVHKIMIMTLAKKLKCCNDILKLFDNTIESSDTENSEILKLNGALENFCNAYSENKENVIGCTKAITLMFLKIINSSFHKMSRSNFFEDERTFINNHAYMQKDSNVDKIMMAIMMHQKITNMIPSTMGAIYRNVYMGDIHESIMNEHKILLTENKSKFEDLSKVLDNLFSFVINLPDDDIDIPEEIIDEQDSNSSEEQPEQEEHSDLEKQIKPEEKLDVVATESPRVVKYIHVPKYTEIVKQPPIFEEFSNYQKMMFTLTPAKVNSLLSRIMYPFKLPNYKILNCQLIQEAQWCEEDDKFRFFENGEAVAIVYKNNKNDIPCWIDYYGYNICVSHKLDENHMFPFSIDILLHDLWEKKSKKIKCGYGVSKTATCLYFYGKYLKNNRWIRGYYEYFLNDQNVLFHRLFKPLKNIV